MSIKKIALCSLLTATIITNNNYCSSNNFNKISKLKEHYSTLKLKENTEDKKALLKSLLLDIKDLKPSSFKILFDYFCIGCSLGINNDLIEHSYKKPSATLVLATIASLGLTIYNLNIFAKDSYEGKVLIQLEKDIISELANLEQNN